MQIVSTRTVVGMEIHLELSTQSKNFTSAPCLAHPDRWDAPANTLVDPVTMALPGTLPVLNREAVELSMMVGIALGSDIPDFCKWDRKNYFYPDLPKGYQISQYDLPLCVGGSIEIETESGPEPSGFDGPTWKRTRANWATNSPAEAKPMDRCLISTGPAHPTARNCLRA